MADSEDGKMGIWMTTALVVGTIIGAAIFMLPVSLAPLGRNALIGWVVSGVGVLCIAFALARISRLGGDGELARTALARRNAQELGYADNTSDL